nr:hemagglutinin repeat-containing protein [Pseudomonas sp. R25(2017)]
MTTRIGGQLDNRKGLIQANGAMDVQATRLDNGAGKVSSLNTLILNSTNTDNRGGLIRADLATKLTVGELDNREKGRISGKGDIEANIDVLSQQGGELVAEGNLTLTGKQLGNREDSLVASLKALTVNVDQIDNRGGSLSGGQGLLISGARLDNSDNGKVLSDTTLGLKVAQIINATNGLIFGKGAVTLSGIGLSNVGGRIVTQKDLKLAFDEVIDNQNGLISSDGRLTLDAGRLDNRLGKLSGLEAIALTSVGAALNQGGLIVSQKGLTFASGSLDNSDAGLISAKGDSTLSTGEFKNRRGGNLATDGTLLLTAAHLDNGGGKIGSQQQMKVSLTSLEQDGGELFSNGDLTLDMNRGLLDNRRGNLRTPGQLLLKNLGEVNNGAGEIAGAKAWSLTAQSLSNDGGKLLSNEKLTLVIDRALSNVKGLIAAAGLDSRSASLDNTDGEIRIRGEAGLTVSDTFGNQAGTVIADAGLTVDAASLDNRREGLVGAAKALKLTVGRLDNRTGELSGKADVSLTGAWLDNSDSGYILAGGNLALTVGEVFNRNGGVLSGDAGLTLTGATLENSGRLSTLRDLSINLSSALNNDQGRLNSEGALSVNAQSLSNDKGVVSSAKALSVNTRGAVSNKGGQLLTDAALTLNSQSLDNQDKGVISSKGNLSLTTGALNNSRGSLFSDGRLELDAGQVTNTAGSLGATTELAGKVRGLDQQGGKFFSKGSLSLDLQGGALNNEDGLINAPGVLSLTNLVGIDNRNGEISSGQAFDLIAASLDNSGGQVLSNQKLTLTLDKALTSVKGKIAAAALKVRAASLDNSDGGVLLSDSDLSVTVDGLLDNGNGTVKAAQQLTLNSSGLNNRGGMLLGKTGINIDLGTTAADLNNQNGLINTKGVLSIAHLRDLDNRKGEISSVNGFSLTGNRLDNRGGNLISNDRLHLTAAEILNQGGLVSGWNGVTVDGGSLDNSQEGTVSSQFGDLAIGLSGALVNHSKGGLGGKGEVTIKAASLDNTAGIITSGDRQSLTLTDGTLINSSGGLIESSGTLDIRATDLNNAGGRITAAKTMTVTGSRLDNTGGRLVGDGSVALDLLGALTNINGVLGSAGPLEILRASGVYNQGGQLISQSWLKLLTAGEMNNSQQGTISADGRLEIASAGTLRNDADGLINSREGDVILTVGGLNNGNGAVQAGNALTVDAGTGAIDNQGGKLIARNGDLTLNASSLDNRGGMLSSLKGLMQSRLTGVLRNGQGGKIEGGRIDLRAWGGIYSGAGRIAANTGDILLDAGSNLLDNSGGGIYAKGLLNATAGSVNNDGGQISASKIDVVSNGNFSNRGGLIESASTLAIRAANLDNQGGKLRALGNAGKTDFQIGSLFDNRNGLVETANTDLILTTPGFLNAGGTVTHVGTGEFGISTANVMNAGGSLVTLGGLTLAADSWTNSSVIQAGRLTVNVNNFTQTASGQLLATTKLVGRGGNWNNDGLIAAGGGLDIQLSGRYYGNGRLSSVGDLGLTAAQIELPSAASITGASKTTLTSRGSLTNLGRLTSVGDLNVNADALINNGTLGGSSKVTITANSLLNQNSLIFSGADMQLRVGTLTNRYADIYGMGDISVSRDGIGGWSSSIENLSGTIESVGDLNLAADRIENRKDVFEVAGGGLVSGTIGVRCETCTSFQDIRYESRIPSHIVWVEKYQSSIVKDSASGTLTAGRNLTGNGREFINNASVVSAGRDLTLNVQNFTNQGATVGEYTVTRWLDAPRESKTLSFWQAVLNYNAANDPDYDSGKKGVLNGKIVMVPNIHTWDMNEVETLSTIGGRQGGGEAIRYLSFGSIVAEYSNGQIFYAPPSYGSGVRTEAPDIVKNATFTRNTTVESGATASANAVVQAGGTVYINASNKLDNGVVRNGNATAAGTSRLGSTQLGGQVTPTVIRINSQLPPDLAQQQVNPLTLPGFTLPAGENGLFRLSHKEGADPTPAVEHDWSIGTIAAATSSRSDGMPVKSATPLQFDQNGPVSTGKRDLSLAERPSLSLGDKTVPVSVNAGTDKPVGVLSPGGKATSFYVQRVEGLPDTSVRSNPHKYLIETNPALTNLKSFMSSDYLLGKLGYDPDTSAKRLGDGLFEQRLVQQAVVARTGQRFIDGQTSDEAMFKYLMNNAVASKNELNLSVGVTLTAQQVAALTHDIVWLEEHEVNGEKVLVPVLYMAQANNRLAPNGALIQGNDVTLIAGGDLNNAGTLKASNNLSAEAGNNLTNSGLIEAGERLTLKAGNDIVNKSGGIISGRDVTLTTTHGDVINQRDVNSIDGSRGTSLFHRDVLDNAARIEAANDLKIDSGRDINNIGGVLQSGRDMTLDADRDINITSVQDRSTTGRGSSFLNQTVTQQGAEVKSGRDLSISAERDITAIASRLDAKLDLDLTAGNNILLSSAANESDYVSRSKKFAQESHSISQQATVLNSGRDIAIDAGNDLGIIASRIKAEENVSLNAEQDILVASAKDESSSYYYKKKNGSFGRSKTTQSESYDSTNVASVIEAGQSLTVNTHQDEDGSVNLDGGRNVTIIGSQLSAGNDLILGAKNDVSVLSATEESGSYSKKTKTGLFGLSSKGSSQLQTNVTQVGSELNAKHDAVIIGGRDINLNASVINADNNAELHAGLLDKAGDINLSSADNEAYSRAEEFKKKLGLSLKDTVGLIAGTPGAGADITANASHKGGREVVSSTSVGSEINAGHDAILKATRDINVIGSGINAGHDANLDAGRDVNVVASIDEQRSSSWETNKSYGIKQTIDNNGFSTFVGNETIKKGTESSGHTAAGSSISAGQNLKVNAGRDVNLQGSDMQSGIDLKIGAKRDINIDAAEQASAVTTWDSVKRNGTTTTIAYNIGNTLNTLQGTGKGEDGVSKGSSVLKSVDTLGQFFGGATFDGHAGGSSISQTQTRTSVTHRPSTLSAANDISLDAGNDVNVHGSRLDAGHDINVTGRDITLDVAHGAQGSDASQTQSKGGLKGGTTGGFKLGVGISNAGSQDESTQGLSTPTQLNAGGSINLDAKNDLTLIGTRAVAERDIKLKAGNDLNILSAQNASSSENSRRSWGAEGGVIAGKDGFGFYGSVNAGLGDLKRQGVEQQEAYLYAGKTLNFESGRDTTIAGATLRGDEVTGDVGRNLTVTSVPNTGKVEGKEMDASLTLAFSIGMTASGSLGYGQTNGKTDWVENQTVISGKSKVDIRTQDHTQLDGAVIFADNGNLKLDTDTLGFRNITGKDTEHGYYLNVGGSYGIGGSQADKPNKGMGGDGKNNWAVEGYKYDKDREQTLNATVGAGEIVVRHDKKTGQDSTAGLNRDLNKAYEVTRDDEHRTDLYVSSTSINAILDYDKTLDKWAEDAEKYGENGIESLNKLLDLVFATNAFVRGNGVSVANYVLGNRVAHRYLIKSLRDEKTRKDTIGKAVDGMTNGATSPEAQAVVERIAQIAATDPELALSLMLAFKRLQTSMPGQLNFAPLAVMAGGALAALGGALLTAANSPQNQEEMRKAVNSLMESTSGSGLPMQERLRLATELWWAILGTSLPIHLLDPRFGTMTNPIVETDVLHPVSAGGFTIEPTSPSSTGGSTIENGEGWSTTSPAVDPNLSPGNMYNSPVDYPHIIGADYKNDGFTPTGAHTLLNGDVRIVPGSTVDPPDSWGVYRAFVEVPDPRFPGRWIQKPGNINSMFPATWDEARIKAEVDAAWNSPNKTVTGVKWKSETPSGVKVQGYTTPRTTVYPIYKP